MNCVNHPDTPAVAFCRTCGKALCPACERPAQGTIYCAEHVPGAAPASPGTAGTGGYSPYTDPYAAPTPPPKATEASPGLAFALGFIPGVGAIYNGQYVKGLIHVIVLGVLISILSSDAAGEMSALFGLLLSAWIFYMAFEAYHTAKRRQLGQKVDEFSGLVTPRSMQQPRVPLGPILLIALGVIFLLNTLDIIKFAQLLRYWPVALIALGAYMLYERISPGPRRVSSSAGVYPEGGRERTQL